MHFTKLKEEAVLPTRSTIASAGYDLSAVTSGTVYAGQRLAVPTGIAIAEAPGQLVGTIKPRSGLSLNHGIDVLAGVIDADYTGELIVILYNTSKFDFSFEAGDRIAQLLLGTYFLTNDDPVVLQEQAALAERGEEGFGSSGK